MANKKLQGITIEIAGNTTKLTDSLKNVNKVIASTNSELKNVNSLLKLDPKNTVLLSQKQNLLSNQIAATRDKLAQLNKAMQEANTKGVDKNSESYRELEREIVATENKLKNLGKEFDNNEKNLKENSSLFGKLKGSMQDAGSGAVQLGTIVKGNLLSAAIMTGLKSLASLMKSVASSFINVGKQSLESYADYEQLVGGVETLFKNGASEVEKNAKKAFLSAGMSANEYMDTVTSFSASLITSLDGDTKKAAKVADMAITDMSDNANKFGTDISSIQNALTYRAVY